MSVESRTIPSAEPNVTPMIDVLLVLLIVFMMVVMQVHHTIDVALPQPCAGTCAAGDQIVLEVLPGPAYRLNQRDVPAGDLVARLHGVYDGRPDKILQIAGDRAVRYNDVMHAMDLAKSAGVVGIGIISRPAAAR